MTVNHPEQTKMSPIKRKVFDFMTRNEYLKEDFIDKYYDVLNWEDVSIHQDLSQEYLEKYSDKVYWEYLIMYKNLSEEVLFTHFDSLWKEGLFMYQRVSENFIRKVSPKLTSELWDIVFMYQDLSNEFIEEFSNCINWGFVDKPEKRIDDFINEYSKTPDKIETWVDKFLTYIDSFI